MQRVSKNIKLFDSCHFASVPSFFPAYTSMENSIHHVCYSVERIWFATSCLLTLNLSTPEVMSDDDMFTGTDLSLF